MSGFAGLRHDALSVLSAWVPPDADQADLRAQFCRFLDAEANGTSRDNRGAHLTASALVVDETRTRTLLTLHPRVGRWLHLGGHLESGDESVAAAALREVREESGIDTVAISPAPVRLDRHALVCSGGPSVHLDVQFLAVVPSTARAVRSAESTELAWWPVNALPPGIDASVRALVSAAASG